MVRLIALTCLALLIAAMMWLQRPSDDRAAIEVKYRYLVVSIEGPPDWKEQHHFTIQWQGKAVSLPVVFRSPGSDNDIQMGAEPGPFKSLVIGTSQLPVTAEPDTEFEVRNTGGFAMIPGKSTRNGVVGYSVATWVNITPPDQPGMMDPFAEPADFTSAGKELENRLRALLAAGRVIDLPR